MLLLAVMYIGNRSIDVHYFIMYIEIEGLIYTTLYVVIYMAIVD